MAPQLPDTLKDRLSKLAHGGPADGPRFRPADPSRPGSAPRPPRRGPGPLARLANRWWNRLLSSVYEGTVFDQEAEYEAGETGRDYLWNTLGIGLWGTVFPVLTIVATQLVGAEQAGMFSIAFVTGTLLMIVANYGVRTFQVSDLEEAHSFASYQVNRWITGAAALVAGALYCAVRGYGPAMTVLCMGVYVYKVVDGVADVYEGRLQQADKLYLAGISQALRSLAAVAAFTVLLFITRDLGLAAIAMAAVAVATLVLVTMPLAFFEAARSGPWSMGEVSGLFRHCFPLFSTLFLFNLIESMPKFAMESMLPYDNQLYFNALFFPAQAILLAAGFIYKPQLLRLAGIWANPRRRRRFDLIVLAMLAVVAGLTAAVAAFMGSAGIPLMGFMYGLDFEPYRGLAVVMVCAGGVTAAIDFLYAIVTVLRRQDSATKPYLITFGFSLFVPALLVAFTGLPGAVVGYLIVMVVLLVLLGGEYIRIRRGIAARSKNPFAR